MDGMAELYNLCYEMPLQSRCAQKQPRTGHLLILFGKRIEPQIGQPLTDWSAEIHSRSFAFISPILRERPPASQSSNANSL